MERELQETCNAAGLVITYSGWGRQQTGHVSSTNAERQKKKIHPAKSNQCTAAFQHEQARRRFIPGWIIHMKPRKSSKWHFIPP